MTKKRRDTLLIALFALMSTLAHGQLPSGWAIACGDGRIDTILDNFDQPWTFCCSSNAQAPTQTIIAGCNGAALAVHYNLNTPASWMVLVRSLPPRNLANYTHVRLSLRGSNLASHDTVDVKLSDGPGRVFTASLKSMTDLPVWRPIYIDFREFVGPRTLDLTRISGLEIGIAHCEPCEVPDNPAIGSPDEHVGTLFLDEFAVVDLKPGAPHRLTQSAIEPVAADATVRVRAANAILARVDTDTKLVPAWFPEPTPNFNTYAEAEAMLVFIYEYEHTGNPVFRDAARNLAARLIALQIPTGKRQAGAWYTAHFGAGLTPPNRAIPSEEACNGDEAMVPDPEDGWRLSARNIDACQWVGNVGWALIALGKLKRSGIYPDAAALDAALERGGAWIARQPSERGNATYPSLVSIGTEGNISGYFGLLSAGKFSEAAALGNAIFQFAWDPMQRRLKPGARPEDAATAIDVSGSWGAVFLRSLGRSQEALDSQGYSASVLRTRSFNGGVLGYGDIAGPYTPAVEFAAQAAVAGLRESGMVMQQLASLQLPPGATDAGAFPGAPDHWYGGPLTPWVTTMPGVSPTAWMYLALCCDPLVAQIPFSDDQITPGATIVRAQHINELRIRIGGLRRRFGLPEYVWSDGTVSGKHVLALHLRELRSALTEVYDAAAHTPPLPSWTDAALLAGTVVKAVHVNEIRDAVRALE